jgi:beta-glucosidase
MSPLYEFGFGLSYTAFEYSNLQIHQDNDGIESDVKVSVDVKNIGKRQGAEVVQLYINDKISSVVTPVIELKGFKKIWINPGEKISVQFTLIPEDLAFIDTSMKPVVEPGVFDLMIGSSSKDIRLRASFIKKHDYQESNIRTK